MFFRYTLGTGPGPLVASQPPLLWRVMLNDVTKQAVADPTVEFQLAPSDQPPQPPPLTKGLTMQAVGTTPLPASSSAGQAPPEAYSQPPPQEPQGLQPPVSYQESSAMQQIPTHQFDVPQPSLSYQDSAVPQQASYQQSVGLQPSLSYQDSAVPQQASYQQSALPQQTSYQQLQMPAVLPPPPPSSPPPPHLMAHAQPGPPPQQLSPAMLGDRLMPRGRSDTELLVEKTSDMERKLETLTKAISDMQVRGAMRLPLGCGSGLSCSMHLQWVVWMLIPNESNPIPV